MSRRVAISRTVTSKGRSLDDCQRSVCELPRRERARERDTRVCIWRERASCIPVSVGQQHGRADSLKGDDNVSMARDGVGLLAVGGEVVVAPEDFVLLGGCEGRGERGVEDRTAGLGDDAAHGASWLWCERHGRGRGRRLRRRGRCRGQGDLRREHVKRPQQPSSSRRPCRPSQFHRPCLSQHTLHHSSLRPFFPFATTSTIITTAESASSKWVQHP